VDGRAPFHVDTKVDFHKTSTVNIEVAEEPAIAQSAQPSSPADDENAKKRWWQFWRKRNQ
jgi:hypothetical protein